jgi:hypothetical protein
LAGTTLPAAFQPEEKKKKENLLHPYAPPATFLVDEVMPHGPVQS